MAVPQEAGANVGDWLYLDDYAPVRNRPGHDRRYAIDPSRISTRSGKAWRMKPENSWMCWNIQTRFVA